MIDPVQPGPSKTGERIAAAILVVAVLLLIVVLVGNFIKLPYAVERPGPVTDTLGELDDGSHLVEVNGAKSYETEGDLYFTTVRVLGGPEAHINGWEWLVGHLDPDSTVLPEDEVFGEDRTEEEVEKMNAAQMQGSQKNSIAVGIRSTGTKVSQENLVAQVAKGLPAHKKLKPEDVIISVDGTKTPRVADIVSAISDRKVGEKVRIGIRRDGRSRTVELTAADIGGGRPGVGIGIEPKYDYPYEVRIDAGRVGGPSAGMMFALAVHDRLTPGALTKGKSIAGTGTINDSGQIGPIGGIHQKMVGAHDGDAEWFLAPKANCDDVVGKVPDGLNVVSVATFDDATTAVKSIAKGDGADLPTCD
ncbi:MAG: YlbL family protein [Janibacter sp.]